MRSGRQVGEAQCLDNLGLAHYSLNQLSRAAEYYEQSMAIWKAEGEKHALMTCCESLGGVCFHMDEHIRSIEVCSDCPWALGVGRWGKWGVGLRAALTVGDCGLERPCPRGLVQLTR
jgi:hypothetical protein